MDHVSLRRTAERLRGRWAKSSPTPPPVVTEPPPSAPAHPEERLGTIQRLAERTVPIEDRLTGRGALIREFVEVLTEDEIEQLMAELDEPDRHWLEDADPIDRRAALIARGVARDQFDLRRRTGLVAAMPPLDVHAMAHVEWATGGDPWYADMIDGALRECGLELRDGARVLDFGCSSGRVVRMLAARRPESEWLGCDVNAAAITWARGALPGIEFLDQPLRPPLGLDDSGLDAAFAISIWSHYAEAPARDWLDELHRVLRPGGLALITTHGPGAIAYRAADPNHGEAAQHPFVEELYRSGFSFVDVFGDAGDWGVVDQEWGVSFISPEWMLREITPKWSVVLYRPAAIDHHQDLWVLRREP